MKKCRECKCEKEKSEYYNQKRYKDGLDPMCKLCRDKTSRQYYLDNKEKQDEYKKNWINENKDRLIETRKAYYQRNKEKYREYYRTYIRKKKDTNEKN